MAFNKAKTLQEAHKFVTQGKLAQAIKQYESIAEKDPGDLALLNVIGDLYIQENNVREALNYFYRLADAYAKERYKVKAIAIYKKISKIDRNTAAPILKMAELNAAQGLTREAREQYKNAFDYFERSNQRDEALAVLGKLCQLDPKNVGPRLKFAQYAERAGKTMLAADAYLATASLAREAEDFSAAENALRRAAELAPANPEVHLYRARQALSEQRPEEVKDILESVPELLDRPQARRLLFESHLAAGKLDAARDLLLDVYQTNPADFLPIGEFTAACIGQQRYDTALEILIAVAQARIERRETAPLMDSLRELLKSTPDRVATLEFMYEIAEKTADETVIPEVLESLGNAYAESGHLEEAELVYARLVAREPENQTYKELLKQALEKQGKKFIPLGQTGTDLGFDSASAVDGASGASSVDSGQEAIVNAAITKSELLVRDGKWEKAVEELERVLHINPEQVEINKRILEICKEQMPRRAVQAAEVLAHVFTAQGNSSAVNPYQEEALSLAQTAARAEAHQLSSSAGAESAGGEAVAAQAPATVKIDLSQPANKQSPPEEDSQLPPPQGIALKFQTLPEPSRNGSSVFNYEESREEIEFYVRHGFYNEARKTLDEIGHKFPDESRLADLRRQIDETNQGQAGTRARATEAGPAPVSSAEQELELPTSFSETSVAGSPPCGEGHAEKSGTVTEQPDIVEHPPTEPASAVDKGDGAAEFGSVVTANSTTQAGSDSDEDSSSELRSLLDDLDEMDDPIDQSADDDETHYNLGVAFREMGLLDEAIGEFQKVVQLSGKKEVSPNYLQGCTLLAACFMDKGMPAIAAKWYSRALKAPGLGHEGMLAIYYDLGIAFEKAGNTTAALEKFTEVYSQNIDYRDVAEKIHLLRRNAH